MRAALYARVSTNRQNRDQTIDSQLAALRQWVQGRAHQVNPQHIFIDEGYSGSRLDRPALDRLRDAAYAGEFDVIAVFSPDRLARRYAYQVLLLEEFRKAGCAVEFVQRPISDDPHDQLLLQIQGAIAEYERAVLRERFRRGRLQKARAGQWTANQAPYGYRYVPKRDGVPGHLAVDEAEAEIVRMLYRWLIGERMTLRQILKRLAAGPWRPRCGHRLWAPSVVHRILSDPVYTGTAFLNRYEFVPPRKPRSSGSHAGRATCRKPRPREEWIPTPAPGLIDEPTHQQALEQLARNSVLSFRNNTRNAYLLRCLLTCRTCGLAMFGVTYRSPDGQPQQRYYKCHGKGCVARDRERRCPQTPAKVEELDAAVWEHVKQLLNDPATLLEQFEHFARQADEAVDGLTPMQKWEAPLRRLDREEQRLLDAYQAEVIDLDELKERRQQIQGRRAILTAQRDQEARLHAERQTAKEVWADLTAFCNRIRMRLDEAPLAERQRILQLLIERVIVGEDTLEIRHVIPLRPLKPESAGSALPGGPGEGQGSGIVPPKQPSARLRSDGVRPAELPHLDPAVTGEPIADDDPPGDLAEDLARHPAAAGRGDGEDRHQRRQGHPQPRLGLVLPPRRLVDVDHLRLLDMLTQLGHGTLQDHGGLPPGLGDHAQRDRQPEQVAGDLLDRALAQAIAAGQQAEHGVQPGAEGPGGHARRHGPAGGGAALWAVQAMEPILGDHRLDRRDLGDLMAQGLGILTGQAVAATSAVRGLAIEGLVDLLGGNQGAGVAVMAGLPSTPLAGGSGGRPSLDGGGIGRRRLGGVGGVLVEPLFEVSDPLFQLVDDLGDHHLGVGGEGLPDVLRDRSRPSHTIIIGGPIGQGNPTRGRLLREIFDAREYACSRL
jgi:site-specific DNA recombinase